MVALGFFHGQRNSRPKFRCKNCDLGLWGQVMHFDDCQRAKQLLPSEKKWQKVVLFEGHYIQSWQNNRGSEECGI